MGNVPNILLRGITGSVAYGLNTPESDVDRQGVFAVPTEKLLGLHPPAQTIDGHDPDITCHDAGKFLSLALKANPTILELLWLPEDLYEIRTPLGDKLIGIRQCFLSRKMVRNAYLGYATQQFKRLESRGDGTFSSDLRKRTAKHARHLARLLTQGWQLYSTGTFSVRLDDPEWYRQFGEDVAAGDLTRARALIASTENSMDMTTSPLPEKPHEEQAEEWLRKVRQVYYHPVCGRCGTAGCLEDKALDW